MKISKVYANDFFDFHCCVDLENAELCPTVQFAKLRHLEARFTPDDFLQMEKNPQRYLSPPNRNPMYMDYSCFAIWHIERCFDLSWLSKM